MSVPKVENPKRLELPAKGEEILKKMFVGYQRVMVEQELGGGFSGGRILVVRPFKGQQAELPAVIKMAPTALIEREQQAYLSYIHNRLPNIPAIVKGVYSSDESWAGLRYPLVGGGLFEIESLHDYLCRAEVDREKVEFTLKERLFKSMDALWGENETQRRFLFQGSYDPLLPVNLLITPLDEVEAVDHMLQLTPETVDDHVFKAGDYVSLSGFVVTEIDPYEAAPVRKEVTLNRPPHPDGRLSVTYRLRLLLSEEQCLADYQVGQLIKPIMGKVLMTRAQALRKLAQQALGDAIDLSAQTLSLSWRGNPITLPNPLMAWAEIFSQPADVRVARAIHGDLNLENVLVDPQTGAVNLIDFADARRDHVLHDFLRLESEVVSKVIPMALTEANLPPEAIYSFYSQLHCATFQSEPSVIDVPSELEKPFAILTAIRQTARDRYLFNRDDCTEYYQGLTIYLLGTLKFGNLDRSAKQVAFWGAATVQQLLTEAPVCPKPSPINIKRFMAPLTIVVVLVVLFVVLIGRLALFQATGDKLPLAAILNVTPEVKVERSYGSSEEAKKNLLLYEDDLVIVHPDASAVISICCKEENLLFDLPELRNFPINCNKVEQLDLKPSYKLPKLSCSEPLVFHSTSESTRADQAQTPLLLSPRNTLITDTRPSFHWQGVEGASGYQIALDFTDDGDWQAKTSESSLSYPTDKPALPRGSTVFVKLNTLDNSNLIDETFLDVMDEASLAELAAAETQIRQLALDETAKSYLLAQLYRQRGMYAAAIAQLEQIAVPQDAISADLWQQLADLYFEIDLYAQAEGNYQTALTIAQADGDQKAKANAYVGLALTANALNKSTKVAQYLDEAEALYRQIGLDGRADQVAELRTELVP